MSKVLDGFTTVTLVLPHTGKRFDCKPLPLKAACTILKLCDETRLSDGAIEQVYETFPGQVGVAPEEFDGLTPSEFMKVVLDFFGARRTPAPPPDPDAPSAIS